MARVNSKKKGNRFELEVAKALTRITDAKWYRVGVSSGARFTKQGIEAFQGDILTEDPLYKGIIIECKATKGRITIEDLANKKSKFWKWIEQVEAESARKDWILIFKANNGKMFFVSKRNNKITKKLELLFRIGRYFVWFKA